MTPISRTPLIPYGVLTLLLGALLYRRSLTQVFIRRKADLDSLLDRQTSPSRTRCTKLLDGMEGCKAIADNALRGPARQQDIERALAEILALLASTLDP